MRSFLERGKEKKRKKKKVGKGDSVRTIHGGYNMIIYDMVCMVLTLSPFPSFFSSLFLSLKSFSLLFLPNIFSPAGFLGPV